MVSFMYDSITEINLTFLCFMRCPKKMLTGKRAEGPLEENVGRFMRFLTVIIMKRLLLAN